MIETRIIDHAHRRDVLLKNDPFPLCGRMIPGYRDGVWDWRVEEFPPEQQSEMCFPEENYDYEAMSPDTLFIGAYDGDTCIGLILVQKYWFRYLHVPDLKVSRAWRGRGVGRLLIQAAAAAAKERGYRGLFLQGQDNNLDACLFYLKTGFRIGGLDTELYLGTSQQGKADILFYLDV